MVLLACYSCECRDVKDNDLKKDNLRGHVKSVTREFYYYNKNNSDALDTNIAKGNYDSKTVTDYNAEGYISNKTHYIYGGMEASKEVFSFDGSGLPVKRELFIGGKLQTYTDYSYEADYRLAFTKEYDADDNFVKSTHYSYDSAGLLESMSIDGVNGVSMQTTKYAYDAEGNVISTVVSNHVGVEGSREAFIRNSTGQLLEKVYYNIGGIELMSEKYNNKGFPSQWDSADQSQVYTYKYDSKGNWIQKLCVEGGKEIYVVKSQYQYY